MWCIVGLGNPGPRYRRSRHNLGFRLIERLSGLLNIRISDRRTYVEWGTGRWCGHRVVLARPLTFMNLSGLGLQELLRSGIAAPGDLVVVHDDIDLPVGRIKFKWRGGDGGHKGIRSITEVLGEDRFLRMRIGIGRPPKGVGAEKYVLEPFGAEELREIDAALERAEQALKTLIQEGLERAMNRYHVPMEPVVHRK